MCVCVCVCGPLRPLYRYTVCVLLRRVFFENSYWTYDLRGIIIFARFRYKYKTKIE